MYNGITSKKNPSYDCCWEPLQQRRFPPTSTFPPAASSKILVVARSMCAVSSNTYQRRLLYGMRYAPIHNEIFLQKHRCAFISVQKGRPFVDMMTSPLSLLASLSFASAASVTAVPPTQHSNDIAINNAWLIICNWARKINSCQIRLAFSEVL
jgi:hypothetical protein